MIEFDQTEQQKNATVTIKVIGVGGAGGNTVNSIIESGHLGIECIVANTDAQVLALSKAKTKVQIGVKSTKGLGAGTNPEIGKRAAEEDIDKIMEVLDDADIVFLVAGMGGGTGSGGIPVIARALREKNILSIAVVTKPFVFEGKRRALVANQAIEVLKKEVDTLIVIPNQKLFDVVDRKVSMTDALSMINTVVSQSMRGISDIITRPGHINVDFADVRTIMKDRGIAVMGTGRARGNERAVEAALQAISSPLLENMSIEGARGVLLNISGGASLGIHEISDAASIIYEQAHEDANIILGSVIDENLGDEIVVTIIATGFDQKEAVHNIRPAVSEHGSVSAQVHKLAHQTQVEQILDTVLNAAKKEVELEVKKQVHNVAMLAKETTQELLHVDLEQVETNDLDIPTFMRKRAEASKEHK